MVPRYYIVFTFTPFFAHLLGCADVEIAMLAAVVSAYAPAPSALATALQAELDALTAANPDFAITLGWKSSTEELALSSGVVKGSLFPDGRADRPNQKNWPVDPPKKNMSGNKCLHYFSQ